MKRFDKFYIGFIVGILLPILMGSVFVEVLSQRGNGDFFATFKVILNYGDFLFKVFVVSVFPNLVGLFVFYKLEYWKLRSAFVSCTFIYFIIAICLM